jgi:lysophospholipase L1-like esterase
MQNIYNIEIQEEINRYGNTNLIANSGFNNNSQIYAFGDSHSIFFYNSLLIKEHWVGNSKNFGITFYSLSKNTDIYNIGTILQNNHEKYNIKKNDYILFSFGFNDIQLRVKQYTNGDYIKEINILVDKYIDTLIYFKNKFLIYPIINCIYPNPRLEAKGVNSCGTFEERKIYTIYTNKYLKQKCKENKIEFFDIYNFITDNDGFIKNIYTKDGIHLDNNNNFLRNFIDNKLIEYCKKYDVC